MKNDKGRNILRRGEKRFDVQRHKGELCQEMMNNYHLKERLSDDYLFMAHYDPRDIADEIINREAKVYA